MKKENRNKLSIVTIFAIAMGFLESTVVVYLREIYYESGFSFPLRGFVEPNILAIEWVREFFTIVMLLAIGYLAGKTFYERFAYFLYSFAIWDIFYYIFLKLTLDWPSSVIEWDVLFLIPWPWAGPVIAPVINSLTMILFAFTILYLNYKHKKVSIKAYEWLLIIAGSLMILYTYMYDYGNLIISNGFIKDFFTLATNTEFANLVGTYVPVNYNWLLYILGQILILVGIVAFYLRNERENN